MVSAAWVPDRGDIVWITMQPTEGHEQSGRRPALVISPERYNAKVGLALMCPITSRVKGYPFEVELAEGLPVVGVVLSDQVRSIDWRARRAQRIGTAPAETVTAVLQRLATLTSA